MYRSSVEPPTTAASFVPSLLDAIPFQLREPAIECSIHVSPISLDVCIEPGHSPPIITPPSDDIAMACQ